MNKLNLAQKPTPIEFLKRASNEFGFEIWVKRDDLTEMVGSGNKVRKLEFLLADALSKKCDIVFTCGGIQSNHARATAYFAKKLGMFPVLFLRKSDEFVFNGNYFINKLLGAEIIEITAKEYEKIDILFEEKKREYEKNGRKVYIIPEGGSNSLGALGYYHAVFEMQRQIDLEEFDVIFSALGSGGTIAGLAAGLSLLRKKPHLIGVNVTKRLKEFFYERISSIIEDMKKMKIHVEKLDYEIIDEFSGPDYAVPSKSDVEVIKTIAKLEGIVLDPVYTGKAFRGMIEVMKDSGKKVLFIHTGGLFGLFAQTWRFE